MILGGNVDLRDERILGRDMGMFHVSRMFWK